MKKQLLTTTALVVAGLVASTGAALAQAKPAKPSLTIGGWVEGIVGMSDQDEEVVGDRVGFDTQYDSEFIFRGAVTLDNGIRIRTVAELEGEVSGDQWDEAYIAVAGSFGEVRIGSDDNAAHLMVTPISGSWATQVGQNLSLDTGDWISAPSGHVNSNIRLNIGDNDSNKVTYFTPRVAGFQFGASYMPSFEECQATGSQNTQCNSSIASTSGNSHNGWAAGLTFDRKFDQVRTAIGVGYATAKPAAGSLRNGDSNEDPEGWSAGALVEFSGFAISAGFKQERNRFSGQSTNSTTAADIDVFDIGASYKWGKNGVSIGWQHAEATASKLVDGDDETDFLLVSYRRELGPGVQYRLNFFHANYDGENAASTDDNDGYAITTSVRVAF